MRLFVNILVALTLVTAAVPVQAQPEVPTVMVYEAETVEQYTLPVGRRCEVNGETFRCFNLEEYRTLLLMNNDLQYYYSAYPLLELQVIELTQAVNELDSAFRMAEEQIELLQAERTRLFEKWQEENALRLQAQNKPNTSAMIGWAVALVELVIIAVMGVGIAL